MQTFSLKRRKALLSFRSLFKICSTFASFAPILSGQDLQPDSPTLFPPPSSVFISLRLCHIPLNLSLSLDPTLTTFTSDNLDK